MYVIFGVQFVKQVDVVVDEDVGWPLEFQYWRIRVTGSGRKISG